MSGFKGILPDLNLLNQKVCLLFKPGKKSLKGEEMAAKSTGEKITVFHNKKLKNHLESLENCLEILENHLEILEKLLLKDPDKKSWLNPCPDQNPKR